MSHKNDHELLRPTVISLDLINTVLNISVLQQIFNWKRFDLQNKHQSIIKLNLCVFSIVTSGFNC